MTLTRLVVALLVIGLLAVYLSWTAGRLDRLHARVDASWAALDAQLVRRAAAARTIAAHLSDPALAGRLAAAAQRALEAGQAGREEVENDLSRLLRVAVPVAAGQPEAAATLSELRAAASRVALARSFHNTAVKDTRTVRGRRIPRLLRLAGHRPAPRFFEIDDTALAG